jgi:hypothetical protein
MRPEYILRGIQYLVYLFTGGLYFVGIATILGIAAGFGWSGLLLLIVPVVLFGSAPGLSLVRPRISAVLASILVAPFFIIGINGWIEGTPASEPWAWMIPANLVFLVSILCTLWNNESIWPHHSKLGKLIVIVLVAAPAITAAVFLVRIGVWLASFTPIEN